MIPEFKIGDLMLSRNDKPLSKLVRFFTRMPWEPPSRVSHAGVVVVDGVVSWVIEALGRVEKTPLLIDRDSQVAVFRHRTMTRDQALTVWARAAMSLGQKYGYATILTSALDWLLGGEFVFRRLTRGSINCSMLAARCYEKVGISFGVSSGQATPDDLWDYVKSHPEEWECVYKEF